MDKASAENIIKLLHEISKEKLVIIVTHNYEQVEEYVTRKITMHDGKVLEDKVIKKIEKMPLPENKMKLKNLSFIDKFRICYNELTNLR